MAHPIVVTFPGTVRFASRPAKLAEDAEWTEPTTTGDARGKPLAMTPQHNDKGERTGTSVVCPAGYRLAYAEAPPQIASFGGSRALPTYVLTMHKEAPVEVVHAELEHETKSVTVVLKAATDKTPELTHTYDEPTGKITATSTKHEGVSAVGASAAEAVRKLKAAVAAHLDKTATADVAAELHKSKPPPSPLAHEDEPAKDDELVTRHG